MDSSIIIEQSGIEFGTSGARGLVVDFRTDVCFAFTLAFLRTQNDVERMAIAIDNRPSSPLIAQACISAAKSVGIEVDYYGVIPTPALAYVAQEQSIPAIMVTGSHIPFDRNGLKFYTRTGEITKQDEVAIVEVNVSFKDIELVELPTASDLAFNLYLQRYLDLLPENFFTGKKIGIYQHSSAGRDLYPKLFEALGADVVCLGYSDEFVPIDTEAVADSDRKQARIWAAQHKLDAIFSTDGDGDRPLLSDEYGEYFTGDILCLLAAKNLCIEALAVPVSCTSAIELTKYFKKVHRTKIGSPYVIEAFQSLAENYTKVAGFEANGGFLLATDININNQTLKRLPTRDALLPVLSVLMLSEEQHLSSLRKLLPSRYTFSDRLKNIDKSISQPILDKGFKEPAEFILRLNLEQFKLTDYNFVDGLRLTSENGDIVHLRPSGNAPELRCYSESDSLEQAQSLNRTALSAFEKYAQS